MPETVSDEEKTVVVTDRSLSRFAEFNGKKIKIRAKDGFLDLDPNGSTFLEFGNVSDDSKLECVIYLKDGMLHNDDGPAVEFNDAHVEYWLNGLFHHVRVNAVGLRMPAIYADYQKNIQFCENGKIISDPNK